MFKSELSSDLGTSESQRLVCRAHGPIRPALKNGILNLAFERQDLTSDTFGKQQLTHAV